MTLLLHLLLALSCGSERASVKQLTDSAAYTVNLTPIDTSIAYLRAIVPPVYGDNDRGSDEKQVWRIHGVVTGYKLEADSDYHVVIADEHGQTMVVELVAPECAKTSRVSAEIQHARGDFVRLIGNPTLRFKRLRKPVKVVVSGIAFMDKVHGQNGGAPNGAELHPVVGIEAEK